MRKFYALLLAVFFACLAQVNAQVTTNGGSGLNATYTDLASAITDLNAATISSPVVITLTGNETAPVGGYSITASGTSTNTITIQGSGSTITAFSPQSTGSRVDAIFKIVGGDYVTIRNFTMQENAGNTVSTLASNTMTEFGIALFYNTATDGAQNNTIQNNIITLSSTYQNAVGVYSSTTHTAGSPTTVANASANSGLNSGLKVYGNTISSVAYGIIDITPANTATVTESGVDIGGTSGTTGNTITYGVNTAADAAWATFSANTAGIYYRNGVAINVQYNNVTSNSMTLATAGVYLSAATTPSGVTYTNTISNNTVNLTGTGAGAITGVDFGYGISTGTIASSNNNITINQNSVAAVSGAVIGLKASYTGASSTLNTNTVTINQTHTVAATATNSSAVTALTLPGGTTGTPSMTANGNTIVINRSTNVSATFTGTLSGAVTGIQGTLAATTLTVGAAGAGNNNTVTIKEGVSGAGTSTYSSAVSFIDVNAAHGTVNVVNNTLNTTGSTIRSTGLTKGINQDATVTVLVNIKSNTMTVDRVAASGTIYFQFTSGGPSEVADTVSNNTVTFTSLSGSTIATAINSAGGPTTSFVNGKSICNNTINISGTHTGTTIGITVSFANTPKISSNAITMSSSGTTMTGITSGYPSTTASFNTFSLTASGTSPTILGITLTSTSAHTVSGNVFTLLSAPAASTSAPVITAIQVSAGTSSVISGNTIQSATTGAGSGSATVTGIVISGGTSPSVFKNKIYGLTAQTTGASTLLSAIRVSSATTSANIYNNLIGFTDALTGVSNADAIRAINLTSSTGSSSLNVYFNTIYMNASSTGTNFGSTGIYHTTSATSTTAALDSRNNIVINLSTPSGTGITSALRRSAAGVLGNYATTSNNNLYYAGTPSAVRAILNDNGTVYGTAASSFAFGPSTTTGSFQNFVTSSRESLSFTGEAGFTYSTAGNFFQSVTGTDATFLHVVAGITTQAESGGVTTGSPAVTDDYDGDTRGSSPDVGADEFVGTSPAPAITFNSITPASCSAIAHTVSVDVTPTSGTLSSVKITYNNGALASGVDMSSAGGNTWTYAIPAASPANTTVTWSVTATNSLGISKVYSGTSYTDAPLTGATATASASATSICSGTSTSLTAALNKSGTATVGSGATTSATYPNPIYSNWANNKMQILYLASELTAAGISAGNISAMKLNLTSTSTTARSNFTINLAHTSATAVTTTFLTPTFTQVYTNTSYVPAVGINTFTFGTGAGSASSFNWDGSSNLLIQVCWDNTASTATESSTAIADNTAFNSVVSYNRTSTTGTSVCGITVTGVTVYTVRPTLTFTANVSSAITSVSWSDGVSTVGTLNPQTVSPTSSTSYTATLTASGCTLNTNSVAITVSSLPSAPGTTPSIQCGVGVPTASASGGSAGQYRWYLAASGGTALASENNSTLSSYSISATTTFYVAINNGTCESDRTPVTVTVNTPDVITAKANSVAVNTSICQGDPISLSVVQTGSTNSYTYSWAAAPTTGSGMTSGASGATASATPTATGSYTYTITGVDAAAGCTAASSVVVAVNTPVTSVSGSYTGTACVGSTINLTSTVTSGTLITENFSEGFEGTFPPASWTLINAGTGNQWITSSTAHTGSKAMQYSFNSSNAANAWAITPGQTLYAGTQYTVSFWYKVISASFPEKLKVTVGTNNTVAAQTTTLWNNNGGTNLVNTTYAQATVTFTPSSTGTYYFGWNCYSDLDEDVLYVDDISITGSYDNATYAWTSSPSGFTASTQNTTATVSQTTTYTITATNAVGCSKSADVAVTAIALPSAPTTTPSTQCGLGVPTASASGGTNGQYRWYLASTGGTALASENNSTLSAYSISTTTTFYVAINNGTCESDRTPVLVTVNTPDAITAKANTVAAITSICLNSNVALSVTKAGSTNTYAYSWASSPSTGSGIATTLSGGSNTVTPTAVGTYAYTVTGVDAAAGCTITSSVSVTVNANPLITSATASPATLCNGSSTTLTAVSIPSTTGTATIGTQATTNITPSPYRGGSGSDCRNQFLYTAAELTAAGLVAGNITTLSFNCTSSPSTAVPNLTIQIGSTSATSLGTTFLTDAVTTVFGPVNYTPSLGVNTHTFSTPFVWDGTSSILINTCSPGGSGSSYNVSIGSVANRAIQAAISGACTATTGTSYNQVVATFGGQVGTNITSDYNWTWTPGSLSGSSVTVSPTTNTTYTVRATKASTTCYSETTVGVTVVTVNAPVGSNSSQCGTHAPTASVTSGGGGNGTFNWYSAATGGTLLQSSTSTTYTTPVSITTTFYVSESGSNGCESARTAVTITVTQPDPVTATVDNPSICNGGSIQLTANQTGSTNNYTFVWTASPASGSGIATSQSGASISVTPTASGTYVYTVTATDGACQVVSTKSVTVKAGPTAVTAGYTGTGCIGTTIGLTSSATANTTPPLSFSEGFEGATFPPTGWTILNAGTSSQTWATSTTANSGSKGMQYHWDASNAANAWAITPGQALQAGTTYTVTFWYKITSTTFPEKMKVTVGNNNTVAAQTTTLWDNNGGSNLLNTTFAQGTATFTPSTSGTYYFGWNCYSDLDEDVLYVDDISITGAGDPDPTYSWTSSPSGFTSSSQNPSGITVSQTTTYTVVVTNANNCSASANVTVTAHAIPSAPTTSNSSQCGTGVPTASASGGSAGEYRWYTASTGGTALSGETNSTLSSYTVSNTTTLYVAINNGFCESTRTAVTITVSHADPVGIIVDNPSICPNDDLKLTADQQGTGTSNYTFTWTASPVSGSGMPTSMDGDVVIVNPTTPGTYTYTLTAHDAGANCTEVATQVITVNTPPSITSLTATPSAICLGSSSTLTAASIVSNAVTATIGTQASTNITPSPYRGGSGSDCRNQFLYTAAELTAAGFHTGYISGVGFNCTSAPSTAVPSLTIQIGSTSATSLGTSFLTDAVTTVYGPTNFIPVTGLNTHTFSIPFYWDGTSSILINTCSPGGGGTSYNVSIGSVTGRSIQTATSGACTATTGTSYNQVVATFVQTSDDQTSSYTWSWSPITGLSAATGSTVTATPTTSGAKTYTVTATSGTTGCSSSQNVSLTVNAVPATPTGHNSTQCGVGVPTASVTGSGGTFKWYSASTGGTLLQTGGSTYTTSISSTTILYVAESNGNCESPRVAVTATVTTPPLISTSGTTTVCAGQSTTIGASSSNGGYTYTWNPGALSGASQSVSPATTTTYTVTATDNSGGGSQGCSTTGTVTITVNPIPGNLVASASTSAVCQGQSFNLTATSDAATPTTILSQDFESGIGSWSAVNGSTGGTDATLSAWTVQTNPFTYSSIAYNSNSGGSGGTKFIWSNADAAGSGVSVNTTLASPVFSTANYNNLSLSFRMYYKNLTSGTAEVFVETSTNGTTWTAAQSYSATVGTATGFATQTISLSSLAGQNTAYIRFRYTTGWGWYVGLDDITLTGTPNYTYSWTSTPAGFTSSVQNPTGVVPTVSRTYTVTATNSYNCSASSTTATVTVNQSSVAPSSASSTGTNICYGTPITLTQNLGSLGTGASWKWYSNPGLTTLVGTRDSANASLTITPATTTTYYVRAEGTASPCTANTAAASVTVTVNQPSVAPDSALASGVRALRICTGSSTQLTQSGGALGTGASWKWYSDAGFTHLVQSSNASNAAITVIPSGTTTYYVRAEGTTSPCAATTAAQSVTVTVDTASVAPTGATTTSTLVCVSTSITLRQTGGHLGTGASWKWYSDASYTTLVGTSGAQDASLTVFPSGNTTYYVRAEGSAPCTPAITASANVSVVANNNNTWIGANNVWDNPANWTCGIVPNGTAADAYIPANASFPVLTSDITLRNLYIQSTTTDVSLNGHTLTLTGGVVGSGLIRGTTSSSLVLSGAAGTVRLNTAYGTLMNLTLTSGASATLGNAVAIYGTVTVGSGAVLNTAGLMTLKSNYAVTARVATSPGTITGNVTVERYITGNAFQAWRLLSVPTQGTQTFRQAWQENQAPMVVGTPGYGTLMGHYAGTGFDYVSTSGNSSLKTYTSSTGTFDVTISSTGTAMQTKGGYLLYIKGDRTITPSMSTNTTSSTVLRTNGTLYQGTQTSNSVPAGKYAVIGNIYASPIDFTALTKDTSAAGFYNTFYLWDPKLYGSSGAGGYQTFSKANGWIPTPGGGSYSYGKPNTTIEQGQAFMVIARSTGSGTIGFGEIAKVAGGAAVFIRTAPANRISSTLKLKGHEDPADGNTVVFGSGYNENVPKPTNMDENFAIAVEEQRVSVASKASIAKEGDRVVYALNNLKVGQEYVLELNAENFNDQQAYLEDSYLHTTTPINLDGKTTVSFTANSSTTGRFTVVFGKTASAPAITMGAGKITVAPNPVTGRIVSLQFTNKAEGVYKVTFTTTAGQSVFTTTVNHTGNSSTQRINLPKQAQGMYNMQIIAPDGKKENQSIVVSN